MVATARCAGLAAALVAAGQLASCFYDWDGPAGAAGNGGAGTTGSGGSVAGGGGAAGQGGGAACGGSETDCSGDCKNLQADRLHCGYCGHECLSDSCVDGRASPARPVTTQR